MKRFWIFPTSHAECVGCLRSTQTSDDGNPDEALNIRALLRGIPPFQAKALNHSLNRTRMAPAVQAPGWPNILVKAASRSRSGRAAISIHCGVSGPAR